jgi:hypothetical protein
MKGTTLNILNNMLSCLLFAFRLVELIFGFFFSDFGGIVSFVNRCRLLRVHLNGLLCLWMCFAVLKIEVSLVHACAFRQPPHPPKLQGKSRQFEHPPLAKVTHWHYPNNTLVPKSATVQRRM